MQQQEAQLHVLHCAEPGGAGALILCWGVSCAACRYNADVFGRIYDVNGEAAIDDVSLSTHIVFTQICCIAAAGLSDCLQLATVCL